MKNYEKPLVFVNEGLAEGIYMASGAMTQNCDDCDWFIFNQKVDIVGVSNVREVRDASKDRVNPILVDAWIAEYPNACSKVISANDPSQPSVITITGLGTEPLKILDRGNKH